MNNKKSKTKRKNSNLKIIIFGLIFLFLPTFVFGAILYLEPDQGEYGFGDHFGLKVRIDTEKECINALSVDLIFPKEILIVEDIDFGESIINIWIKKPTSFDVSEINQKGKIHFSGGIPGGYCGRLPGDPMMTNVIAEIRFFIPSFIVGEIKEDLAEIKILKSSQVLLNDGFGTPAKLTTKQSNIKIISTALTTKNEWKEKLLNDKNLPELFEIEIQQDPAIFEGKYFIIFQTTDKETGIDYYQVAEVPPGKDYPEWQVAESPYLLKDQKLESKIMVKAVDKAGNSRVVERGPVNQPPELIKEKKEEISFFEKVFSLPKIFFLGGLIILILVIIIIILLWKYFLKRKKIKNFQN